MNYLTDLPIDLQDLIYTKANIMIFNDCLKGITKRSCEVVRKNRFDKYLETEQKYWKRRVELLMMMREEGIDIQDFQRLHENSNEAL